MACAFVFRSSYLFDGEFFAYAVPWGDIVMFLRETLKTGSWPERRVTE